MGLEQEEKQSREAGVAQLQGKVDLLCQDLVKSNQHLALMMGDLRFLCHFQQEIMGQNDLGYLLHQALQILTSELDKTSGAVFLASTRKFEAHVSGLWQRGDVDLETVESGLQDVVIEISRKQATVSLAGDGSSYAILGLPVIVKGDLVAVAVFYRGAEMPFGTKEQARIHSCLPSLGRQILAVQRLHEFLAKD